MKILAVQSNLSSSTPSWCAMLTSADARATDVKSIRNAARATSRRPRLTTNSAQTTAASVLLGVADVNYHREFDALTSMGRFLLGTVPRAPAVLAGAPTG